MIKVVRDNYCMKERYGAFGLINLEVAKLELQSKWNDYAMDPTPPTCMIFSYLG